MQKRLAILLILTITLKSEAQFTYNKNKHSLTYVIRHLDLLCTNSFFGDTVLYLLTTKKYPDLDTANKTLVQKKAIVAQWHNNLKLWKANLSPIEQNRIIHFNSEGKFEYFEIFTCNVGDYLYTLDKCEIDDYKFTVGIKRRRRNEEKNSEFQLDYIYDLISSEKTMYTFRLRLKK